MLNYQLNLFPLPPPQKVLFELVPKNQKVEIITKNCSPIWELIDQRISWDGKEEYLLRSSGLSRLTYWVRLVDDNNFWIARKWLWQDPNSPERKQAHVDWLAETGQYVRSKT